MGRTPSSSSVGCKQVLPANRRKPATGGTKTSPSQGLPPMCRRGRTLTDAFDHLSSLLPCYPPNKKMTKIETLRLAMMYIKDLRVVVEDFNDSSDQEEEVVERVNSPAADVSLEAAANSSSGNTCNVDRPAQECAISDRSKMTSPSLRSSRSSLVDGPQTCSVASPSNSVGSSRTTGRKSPQSSRRTHGASPSSLCKSPPSSVSLVPGPEVAQHLSPHSRAISHRHSPTADGFLSDIALHSEALNWPASLSQFDANMSPHSLPSAMQTFSPCSSAGSASSAGFPSANRFNTMTAFSLPELQFMRASPTAGAAGLFDIPSFPSPSPCTQDVYSASFLSRDNAHCKLENAAMDLGMPNAWSSMNSFFQTSRPVGMVGGMGSFYP